MAEDIVKLVEADLDNIQVSAVTAESENERVMKLCAHVFLRVWTRMALETGQRLSMTPFQYSLGVYHGQMKWELNESLNFRELPQIELSGDYGKKHALLAESYQQKGEDRFRVMFALEEEEVKGKPVPVNYLVYDANSKEFAFDKAVEALKPALAPWFQTVQTKSDPPLWEFCKQNLECVGV